MDELLIVNDIIEFIVDGRKERILWINYQINSCITIKLEISTTIIAEREISSILVGLENNTIQLLFEDDSHISNRNLEVISDVDKKLLNQAWEVVQFIAAEENEPQVLLNKKFKRKLIIEAIERFKIGDTAIYLYLRKYWQGGKLKASLLSDYYKCGGKGKAKVLGENKTGRPNKICTELRKLKGFSISEADKETYLKHIFGEESNLDFKKIDDIIDFYKGVNITQEHRKKIDLALKRHYLNPKELPLTKVYDLMIKDFYTFTVDEHNNINKKVIGFNNIPKFEAVKKYYYKHYRDKENIIDEVIKLRVGKKNYSLKSRAIKSNSTFEAFGPGFRYQIDSTIPGIHIKNRIKDSLIGKSTLYFVIDVFSRLIVGIYVGIDNPSWQSASTALFNCIEDKVKFCEQYGIQITKDDWPQSTLPKNLLADRGELVGGKPEKIIESLKVNIENTASWRAEQKGIVEQSFNLAEEKIKHWIPGAIKQECRKRGERDSRLDAILNIDELTKVFIRAVLHHNSNLMPKYPLSPEMIRDGVKPIPTEIWSWGVKNISGSLTRLPKDVVMKNLMSKGEATITEKGIKFIEQHYDCDLANQKGWYSRARILNYDEVDCYYDERNMDSIYLTNDDTGYLIRCTIMPEYEVYKGKTFYEVKDYQAKRDIGYDLYKDKVNQNNVNLNVGIDHDVKDAEKTSLSNAGKVKDIKINRIVEREKVSKEQALWYEKKEEDNKASQDIDIEKKTVYNKTSNQSMLLSRLERARKGK